MRQALQLPSSASTSLLCFCIFAALIIGTHTIEEPTVSPEMNLYVPSNLIGNTTYACSIAMLDGTSLTWEIWGGQIRTNEQFLRAVDNGIYIEPWPTDNTMTVTTLTVSERARQIDEELSVQCVASHQDSLPSIKRPQEPYNVISYGQPDAVKILRLALDGDLSLRWERPGNVPREVPILYTIMMNNTDTLTNYLNITNTTSFSLRSLEEQVLNNNTTGVCVMFEFSVSGSNDAGMGQPNTIIDTIPISPDVTLISTELKVERVDLQPFSVQISFPPVKPCSINFPLHNYTIQVGDEVIHVVNADVVIPDQDGRVRLKLNSTILSGVTLDDSYNLTVTPCNDITCRTSDPVTLNTTDVQRVEAIFFENWLYSYCSFANNSLASGCLIKLLLRESNETDPEDFEISRAVGNSCNMTNNRFEAYSGLTVVDIKASGVEGNFSLPVSAREVYSQDEFMDITGCDLDLDLGTSSPNVEPSNIATIAASVTVTVIVVVALVVAGIIFPIVIIICIKRKRIEVDFTNQASFIVEHDGPGATGEVSPVSGNIYINVEYDLRGDVLTLKLKQVIKDEIESGSQISICSRTLTVNIE